MTHLNDPCLPLGISHPTPRTLQDKGRTLSGLTHETWHVPLGLDRDFLLAPPGARGTHKCVMHYRIESIDTLAAMHIVFSLPLPEPIPAVMNLDHE